MTYQLEMIRTSGVMNKEDLNQSFIYKIHLVGNFVMEISDEFNLVMSTLIGGGMRKVVFDVTSLKYIDSTGIGILISVTKAIRAKGGDIVMLNVNQKILEVFNLVKLNDFIQFFKGDKQVTDHFFAVKA